MAAADLIDERAFRDAADALRGLLADAEAARHPTGVVRYLLALRDAQAAHHGNTAQTLEVLWAALREPDCPAAAFTDVLWALRTRDRAAAREREARVLAEARRRFPDDPLVATFEAESLRGRARRTGAGAASPPPDPEAVRAADEAAYRVLEPFVDCAGVPLRALWAIEAAARATERLSVAQRTLRAIGAHPEFDDAELPALRCVEADVYGAMGLPADAAALFEEAIALTAGPGGDALDAGTAAHLSLAALAYRDGDPTRAFGHVREVVGQWRAHASFDVGNGIFLFRPGNGPPEMREAALPGAFLRECASGEAQPDVPPDLDPWIAAAAIVDSEDGVEAGRLRPSTIATLVERAAPIFEDPTASPELQQMALWSLYWFYVRERDVARAVGVALDGAALWVGRNAALARDPARAEALGITPKLPPSGLHNGLVLPFPDGTRSPEVEERVHKEAVRVLRRHTPIEPPPGSPDLHEAHAPAVVRHVFLPFWRGCAFSKIGSPPFLVIAAR